MTSRRLVTLAMLLGMTVHAVSWAADSKPLDPNQSYAKKATWVETMISTRANVGMSQDAWEVQSQ